MIYAFIALIVALVLGPVLWLKPSPAQARQTRLRLRARALGLEVRLCSLPQTRRSRVRKEPVRQGAVYRLPVHDRAAQVAVSYLVVREAGAADFESEKPTAPPQALAQQLDRVAAIVPADVVGIELAPEGPAFYWSERGDEEVVTLLAAQLTLLRDTQAALRGV